MKKRRFSGDDKHLWPFTLSRHGSGWRPLGIMLDSGGESDDCSGAPKGCSIRFSAFGYSLICELPQIIPDFKIRHEANWDAETVARLGRDHYFEVFDREYGFHFSDKTLHVHYGPQTHDSRTTKSKCYFLPWLNWTFKRTSYYALKGEHFWTEPRGLRLGDHASWIAKEAVMKALPKVRFEFDDFEKNSSANNNGLIRKKFGTISGRKPASALMAKINRVQDGSKPPTHLGKMFSGQDPS